jgi:hypothetical protein
VGENLPDRTPVVNARVRLFFASFFA